jgi:hypothetical protein
MPRASRRLHIATVSRLKALLSLVENFSRLTLVNAGATSAKWKHIVPGWVVAAGKGTSTALGALISTTFASANAIIVAKNPAAGVGPAFWITDSGNYWSVAHNVVNICQSCTACGSYNSCTYCSSYGEIAQGGCTAYGNCNGSICNGGYSTCSASACAGFGSCPGYVCVGGYGQCLYEYCSRYQNVAVQGCAYYYTYSYTYCSSYSYTYKGGSTCSGYSTGYQTVCGYPYTYYTNLCYEYTSYYYTCCLGSLETYYYTCCTGGYYDYTYSCCPGGFYDYTYTCCTGSYFTYYTYGCTGYSNGVSSACGCASYYTYDCGCQDYHRIDLSKKVSGTETVISSTANSLSNVAGIKVVTSGDNVTASAYSDTNLTSQNGSDLSSTNTGQKPKEHGIISKASITSQGYTIDEFRVN